MPNYVSSRLSLNLNLLGELDDAARRALAFTAEEIRSEVVQMQVMPFDTGNMQNAATFVDTSGLENGHVSIVTSAPQARRLYFHPEYNFQKVNNSNAGGMWFDSWVTGLYARFPAEAFAAFLQKERGIK